MSLLLNPTSLLPMKTIYVAAVLALVALNVQAQNQTPTAPQSTTGQPQRGKLDGVGPVKKTSLRQRLKMESKQGTEKKEPSLRPDSLRRGGVTAVDSVR